MSVQKLDFSHVIQSKRGFTTFLNEVVQNITDGFILGVYTYLSTLPPDWNVNRVQLGNHFRVGRDKINDALAWLNDNYLIEYKQDRDEKGNFLGSYIEVQDGYEFLDNFPLNQTRSTATLKTRCTDYPLPGKSAPTKDISFKKNIINKKDIVFIPDFLNKELWEKFKDHRVKIRKRMTDYAIILMIRKLTKFYNEGLNIDKILEESIINGWSNVFDPRKSTKKSNEDVVGRPKYRDFTQERLDREEQEQKLTH